MRVGAYRIKSYIAPSIEEDLICNNINDDVYSFFVKTLEFVLKLKHVIILLIPFDLMYVFDYPKLKGIKEVITTSTQSRIIFVKNSKDLPCLSDNSLINNLIVGFEYSTNLKISLINCIYLNQYPVLLDYKPYSVIKNRCNCCENINSNCGNGYSFDVVDMLSNYDLSFIDRVVQNNIDFWYIDKNNINFFDLKGLAYLYGILFHFDEKHLNCIDDFKIHEDIFIDFKKSNAINFSNISFTMLRAIAFPGVDSTDRHQYSIDCHINNPKKVLGYNLFRVDVMPPSKSGVSSSGVERLLLACKDSTSTFICYTNDHDFNNKLIQQRIASL